MSPFLFILAMEGLHALTCKAEALGLFKGASIGRDNLSISHLMYADDVIFFGEWSWVNAYNLISMLRCFFLISGLKINIHKSNVLGVGVIDEEVSHMANIIGCGATKFPLKYLGVPIGNGNDSRFWDDIWCGEQPLKVVFPRIYLLDTDKSCKIASRVCLHDWNSVLRRNPRGGVESVQFNALKNAIGNISLTDQRDSWQWSLDASAGFSVASLNKLPSRVNLDRRGIEVGLLLCPSCLGDFETVNHSFFNFGMAKDLWSLLAKWWELDIPVCGNIAEWYDWLGSLHVPS
ncbi:RNA-directed DNA polymerase, eukaryota, reverse transcriptase zinc-binding domain protein [Tanacetum coccineum]